MYFVCKIIDDINLPVKINKYYFNTSKGELFYATMFA